MPSNTAERSCWPAWELGKARGKGAIPNGLPRMFAVLTASKDSPL
jgi:hypothetical protein